MNNNFNFGVTSGLGSVIFSESDLVDQIDARSETDAAHVEFARCQDEQKSDARMLPLGAPALKRIKPMEGINANSLARFKSLISEPVSKTLCKLKDALAQREASEAFVPKEVIETDSTVFYFPEKSPESGIEGGDIVESSLVGTAFEKVGTLAQGLVKGGKVVSSVAELHPDDNLASLVFIGHGCGRDYRSKILTIQELAQQGFLVVPVDLADTFSAQNDVPLSSSNRKGAKLPLTLSNAEVESSNGLLCNEGGNSYITRLPAGSFFHLDTVFRPTPGAALVYPESLPKASLSVMRALYDEVIELDSEESLNFAANGRFITIGDNESALVYRDVALNESRLNLLAKANGCIDYLVDEQLPPSGLARLKEPLSIKTEAGGMFTFIPVPTTQAWLGGGSVSCITNITRNNAGQLTFHMRHPNSFHPEVGINEIERALMPHIADKDEAGVDLKLLEYQKFVDTVQSSGISVMEHYPNHETPEEIYTRDASTTFIEHRTPDGNKEYFHPANHVREPGDRLFMVVSQMDAPTRKDESWRAVVEAWEKFD